MGQVRPQRRRMVTTGLEGPTVTETGDDSLGTPLFRRTFIHTLEQALLAGTPQDSARLELPGRPDQTIDWLILTLTPETWDVGPSHPVCTPYYKLMHDTQAAANRT